MTHAKETQNQDLFWVVVNHEEQYSIWPVILDIPPGWKAVDVKGTRSECLAYIGKVWKDTLPLSLRKKEKGMETRD